MLRSTPCLFLLCITFCKLLEDGADSGQSSQEATNSSDAHMSDAQPVNDLALKVERSVFFYGLPDILYLSLRRCFCWFWAGGCVCMCVYEQTGLITEFWELILLPFGKHLCGHCLDVCDTTRVDTETACKLISFLRYSERKG